MKKYVDDSIDEGTKVTFNQTLQNYLKVYVGNDTYKIGKNDKILVTDIIIIRHANTGGDLPQNWVIKCNDKNTNGKIQIFIRSTKTNSPAGDSGAMSLPPIGESIMCMETSFNNHGNIVFVSIEQTDIIQKSNITFYYNRLSILTNDSLKSMVLYRIQLLIEDNTWTTQNIIAKIDRYGDTSTDWTLSKLDFTQKKYDIKLIYDQIDTPHADMFFSNNTKTHSV